MRELTKSILKLSWAASLYGAEQLATWLRPGEHEEQAVPERPDAADVSRSLDAVTRTARSQLGPFTRAMFLAGADLQSELVDAFGEAYTRDGWRGTLAVLGERSREALRFATPDAEGAMARQEFRNRVEAYRLVIEGRKIQQLPPPGEPFSLSEAVAETLRLDPHRVLWAMEALGHAYGETASLRSEEPRDLLSDAEARALPLVSLPMLHAGMGLAFAEHLLRDVGLDTPALEVHRLVERFVSLCHTNAIDTHLGGALEALGLVARGVHPELISKLEAALAERGDEELQGYFWHGVGRALYFVPIHLVPGYSSVWHAVEMAQRETPHELAWRNTLAGVATAATLVNMGHPRIFEHLLRHHGEVLRGSHFTDGVLSAVMIRQDLTPDRMAVGDLLRYRPHPSEPELVQLYEELIVTPCEAILNDPPIRPDGRPLVPFTELNVTIRQAILAAQHGGEPPTDEDGRES